jgi:hypothetical protein
MLAHEEESVALVKLFTAHKLKRRDDGIARQVRHRPHPEYHCGRVIRKVDSDNSGSEFEAVGVERLQERTSKKEKFGLSFKGVAFFSTELKGLEEMLCRI